MWAISLAVSRLLTGPAKRVTRYRLACWSTSAGRTVRSAAGRVHWSVRSHSSCWLDACRVHRCEAGCCSSCWRVACWVHRCEVRCWPCWLAACWVHWREARRCSSCWSSSARGRNCPICSCWVHNTQSLSELSCDSFLEMSCISEIDVLEIWRHVLKPDVRHWVC